MRAAIWVGVICAVGACRSSASGPAQQPVEPAAGAQVPAPPDDQAELAAGPERSEPSEEKKKIELTDEVIDPIRCDDIDPTITVQWGQVPEKPPGWSREDFKSEHNHSLVVRVDFGESSFLVTGDLERAGIGAARCWQRA